MSSQPTRDTRKVDRTAAVTLEVPAGVADDIEGVLKSFAQEADLDTSLVVDHGGFLIAGISSIADVDVDTIGSLVAGACGATEGLTGALGENGKVESLHLGEDRLMYLREVGERFILVGVSDSNIPAGILRDQADRIESLLEKHLNRVKAVPMSLTKKAAAPAKKQAEPAAPPQKSLRPTPPPKPEQPEPPKKKNISVTANKPTTAGKQTLPQQMITAAPKPKPSPSSQVFEIDDEPAKAAPAATPPAPPVAETKPAAIVENSPFEVDFDDDDSDQTIRPKTTPVHLSVPEARKRDAETRKQNEEEYDENSGPRYSFELG